MTALDPAAPVVGDRAIASRIPYAVTIFLGAFLLFQIQPLMGKFIIPWYGGLPSAWTGCLIFFQGGLLAGYLYAHLLVRHLAPRSQAILHTLLLVACLALLPIAPGSQWKPAAGTHSMGGIFLLLSATVGLPYLLLASTGPMTQAWFHRSFPTGAPYRLFALSNLGSMLGLLSYPFFFEPWFTRTTQGWIWAGGFALFVVSCSLCGFSAAAGTAPQEAPVAVPARSERPSALTRFLWVALPACASLLLLSVTNQLCQGMPSVPFLWILPLSLYLLSFIVCFEWPQLYSRPVFLTATMFSLAWACYLLYRLGIDPGFNPRLVISSLSAVLFLCCMVCHGELALSKPDPSRLTGFYLAVSAGGALGGAFVGLAAPHLFNDFFELHWGFFLCPALVLLALFTQPGSPLHRGRPLGLSLALVAAVVGLGIALNWLHMRSLQFTIASSRDFFGVLKLFEVPSQGRKLRLLGHGGIIHGFQWVEPAYWKSAKTSYFGPGTGVADAFTLLGQRQPLNVGVIGLGIGTLAAWGREGDRFRFYEINPSVVRIAHESFSYLDDSRARVEVVDGDGRLALEAEPDQAFDLLVLDAFNGDSPPIHLMTADAFRVYRRHLKPDGVLAVNITNKFLGFEPVVRALGETIGLSAIRINSNTDMRIGVSGASWMLLSGEPGVLEPIAGKAAPAPDGSPPATALWTDDYANVLSIVR